MATIEKIVFCVLISAGVFVLHKNLMYIKKLRRKSEFSNRLNNAAKSFMESPEWDEIQKMANEPDDEKE